jgi:hypothetical protein
MTSNTELPPGTTYLGCAQQAINVFETPKSGWDKVPGAFGTPGDCITAASERVGARQNLGIALYGNDGEGKSGCYYRKELWNPRELLTTGTASANQCVLSSGSALPTGGKSSYAAYNYLDSNAPPYLPMSKCPSTPALNGNPCLNNFRLSYGTSLEKWQVSNVDALKSQNGVMVVSANGYLIQDGITLVPGRRYRMMASVKRQPDLIDKQRVVLQVKAKMLGRVSNKFVDTVLYRQEISLTPSSFATNPDGGVPVGGQIFQMTTDKNTQSKVRLEVVHMVAGNPSKARLYVMAVTLEGLDEPPPVAPLMFSSERSSAPPSSANMGQ